MTGRELRCNLLKYVIGTPASLEIDLCPIPPQYIQWLELRLQGAIVVDRDQETAFRICFTDMPSLDVSREGNERLL